MNETKHTPGPWVSSGRRVGIVDRSETQAFGMMLVVAHIDEYDHPEHEANARLIAAAPDLLEALQGVLKIARGTSGRIIIEGWQEDVIRAAIAKATGEQP